MTAGYVAAVLAYTVGFCTLVLLAAAVCTWVGARFDQAAGRRRYVESMNKAHPAVKAKGRHRDRIRNAEKREADFARWLDGWSSAIGTAVCGVLVTDEGEN